MAPLRRPPSRGAQPLKSILKTSSGASPASGESLFPASKKDKRRIKHAQLLNKVTKSSEKKPRRRRPNKKLVTTLDALADALPDHQDDLQLENGANGSAGSRPVDQINIIKRKSMNSRPGAMKRREKLDQGERERFAKNMAQLATPTSRPEATKTGVVAGKENSIVPSTSDRWAALRGFISQTLETKPGLENPGR